MYRDYLSINGTTIVSDEKGMHQIETTDKIAQELYLENEIELIELNINELNREKKKLGTIKENKKTKKWNYVFGVAMIIFVVLMCKNIHLLLGVPDVEIANARFSFIQSYSDALLCTMLPVSLLMLIPITLEPILKSNRNIKEVKILDEQLDFLSNELSKKREELETLRKNSKKADITETNIHLIDNSKYRAILKERLNLLWYIKKYRNKLKRHLENGTLLEEFRSLEIEPENISFAEETLKRVLEK